jgi:hypothetical protein
MPSTPLTYEYLLVQYTYSTSLDYAFAYACYNDTSMGHYTWYLVPCNELWLVHALSDSSSTAPSESLSQTQTAHTGACVWGRDRASVWVASLTGVLLLLLFSVLSTG